mmetsp:Transcript_57650/g.115483  ORF Transcript_57650/g.115483 Transcript_57650/m.115483 type:complete len:234 (-) Transcript_57650:63-764(-)
MVEALRPTPAFGRAPELDVAELRSRAESAEAALARACEVPVPESDVDQNSVRGDVADDSVAWPAEEDLAQAYARLAAEDALEAAAEDEHQEPTVAVIGDWVSAKGECCVFEDHRTHKLSYEEFLDNGCRLHGFLTKLNGFREDGIAMAWEASLAILDQDEDPWYGPSFGEPPEPVGDIQVRLRSNSVLETRIRVAGEDDDWQPPSIFRKRKKAPAPVIEGAENVFVFGGSPRH